MKPAQGLSAIIGAVLTLIAHGWQVLADLSSRGQAPGALRAAAFVRYAGADDLGHVGWGFDMGIADVGIGAVENTGGTFTADVQNMGYWQASVPNPMRVMQQHSYNDLKFIDVPDGDIIAACGAAKWVGTQPYCAIGRNCLDDVYDVLRAYGVSDLPLPSFDILPDEWFIAFRGQIASVATYQWQKPQVSSLRRALGRAVMRSAPSLQPTWRTPGHPDWHDFQQKLAADAQQSKSLAVSRAAKAPVLYYGMDRYSYAGKSDMQALKASTKLSWTGLYLAHKAGSQDTSWLGAWAELRGMGWGIAPIYKAAREANPQTGAPASWSAEAGSADGRETLNFAQHAGLPAKCVVFLDIEQGGLLPDNAIQYIGEWANAVRAGVDGYTLTPGIYCSWTSWPQVQKQVPSLIPWVWKLILPQLKAGTLITPEIDNPGVPVEAPVVGARMQQFAQNCDIFVPGATDRLNSDFTVSVVHHPGDPSA